MMKKKENNTNNKRQRHIFGVVAANFECVHEYIYKYIYHGKTHRPGPPGTFATH